MGIGGEGWGWRGVGCVGWYVVVCYVGGGEGKVGQGRRDYELT